MHILKKAVGLGVLLLLFVSLQGCQGSKSSRNVVIVGQILHYNPYDAVEPHFMLERAGVANKIIAISPDKQGCFQLSYMTDIPVLLTSRLMKGVIVAQPGDRMFVTLDARELDPTVFTGDGASLNTELNEFMNLFDHTLAESRLYKYSNDDVDSAQYIDRLLKVKQVNAVFLSYYKENYELSDEAEIFAEKYLQSHYLKQLSNYQLQDIVDSRFTTYRVLPNFIWSELQRLSVHNAEDYVHSDLLYQLAYAYRRVAKRNLLLDGSNYQKYCEAEDDPKLRELAYNSYQVEWFIDNVTDEHMLQLLIAQFMKNELTDGILSEYGRFTDVFNYYVKIPFLKQSVEGSYARRLARAKGIKYGKEAPSETEIAAIDALHQKIREATNGALSYIVCWTPWMTERNEKLADYRAWLQKLEDEGVNVLLVTVDATQQEWKRAKIKDNLPGHHVFLDASESNLFKKEFSVEQTPSFLILDKQGHLVNEGPRLEPAIAYDKYLSHLLVSDGMPLDLDSQSKFQSFSRTLPLDEVERNYAISKFYLDVCTEEIPRFSGTFINQGYKKCNFNGVDKASEALMDSLFYVAYGGRYEKMNDLGHLFDLIDTAENPDEEFKAGFHQFLIEYSEESVSSIKIILKDMWLEQDKLRYHHLIDYQYAKGVAIPLDWIPKRFLQEIDLHASQDLKSTPVLY